MEVQEVIRVINQQIRDDFEPYWSMGATLRLEGKTTDKPDSVHHPDLRGDAIIYLWDKTNLEEAMGYHSHNFQGIPYSFVFVELAEQLGDNWTVIFSHEALEMIVDPSVNLLCYGPNPEDRRKKVLYYYEVCDAVQADVYSIDGIEVSNFVLPLYFTSEDEYDGRNDFLGRVYNNKTLTSFGVNPGGYMGYFDPETRTSKNVFGDEIAKERMKKKEIVGDLRRGARYEKITF